MAIIESIIPTLEHLKTLDYWLIFLLAFVESIAFIGVFIPGTVFLMFFGFLWAQETLAFAPLLWASVLGAIFGDGLSFYLGGHGTKLFKEGNRILKQTYLDRGKAFFHKYGRISVFSGRFIGPMRPIIPFVAGLSHMDRKTFFLFDIVSAFLWSITYLLLGYFFGAAWLTLRAWSRKIEILGLIFVIFFLIIAFLHWVVVTQGPVFFRFVKTIFESIGQGIKENPDVKRLVAKYPRFFQFLSNRLERKTFTGAPLSFLILAFAYTLFSLTGLVEGILKANQVITVDHRLANLLYAFREIHYLKAFLWITFLGKATVVIAFLLVASFLFWLYGKRHFLVPFWITVGGSSLFAYVGKITLHRPRPVGVSAYVEPSFSFPSGHATIAVAFYGFIFYALMRHARTWKRKMNLMFVSLVLIFLIGFSRLYLGVHYLSDVMGGYFLGFLWLILGISILEWEHYQTREVLPIPAAPAFKWKKSLTAVLLILSALFYGYTAIKHQPTLIQQEETLPAETLAGGLEDILALQNFPKYTETLSGNTQEPLSFIIAAPGDAALTSDFNAASWILAEPIRLKTLLVIFQASIMNRNYPTAPITPSFWNQQVHDFGFQKPTQEKTIRKRHHARLWKTDFVTSAGLNIYVGTVSEDVGIKWPLSHRIAPDVDTERDNLIQDLQAAGVIVTADKKPWVNPQMGTNFTGDPFFTDGKISLLELK